MSDIDRIVQVGYDKLSNTVYRLTLRPSYKTLVNMCHLEKSDQLTNNNNFKSYRVVGDIPMHGMAYINTEPTSREINRIINPPTICYTTETYEEYLEKMDNIEDVNTIWIKKIMNGTAEQDKVIKRTDEYIIVRDWKFDVKTDIHSSIFDLEELHLLGIPTITIKSIRDIECKHIPLLDTIKESGLNVCETVFGINRNQVKIYFHYPPSTFQLHIHFTWVGLNDITTNFERAHDYDKVIKNIKLDPAYYRSDMRYVLID